MANLFHFGFRSTHSKDKAGSYSQTSEVEIDIDGSVEDSRVNGSSNGLGYIEHDTVKDYPEV